MDEGLSSAPPEISGAKIEATETTKNEQSEGSQNPFKDEKPAQGMSDEQIKAKEEDDQSRIAELRKKLGTDAGNETVLPEQTSSTASADYNRYQALDGRPNQAEIKKLEQAFSGKEVKDRWNATQVEIGDDRVQNGRLMIGENGLSFDTKQLAMGMLASAERTQVGDQSVVKLKYPHLKDGQVENVSELYLTPGQYDKLRGVIRTDLEDQGVLNKKEEPITLDQQIAETERLARKTGTQVDAQRFITQDNNYRADHYNKLAKETLTQAGIDFGTRSFGDPFIDQEFSSLVRTSRTSPNEQAQAKALSILNATLASKYALGADKGLSGALSEKYSSLKAELSQRVGERLFADFLIVGNPEDNYVTEEVIAATRPGGRTVEGIRLDINFAAKPQRLREFARS